MSELNPQQQPSQRVVHGEDAASALGDDRPHRPADDREEIYYQGTPMLRGEMGTLFAWALFGVVLMGAPVAWWYFKDPNNRQWPPWWVTVPCVLLGLLALMVPSVLARMTRYRISNYRIDYEKGLFSRTIETLELWHVEDIRMHQSFMDRVLGVGTVTVISHDDTTPKLELKSVPNPRPLFEQLKQRVIAVKRQRGVIKMDVG